MNSAATIEGTPASTSTMKVVTRASRPEPYSTRYTAVIKPSGTAIDRRPRPACTSVPYTAWYTPPANSSGSTPRSEWVHQPDRVTAYQPRATTTDSTQPSGTSATRNEARKNVVAMWFLIRRRIADGPKHLRLDRLFQHVEIHPLTFPPAIIRAAALTMNVRTNSANPAEM